MTGETAAVRAVASCLRHDAEQVRELALRVAATREIAWRSRAAEAFRERVGDRVAGLHRAAVAVEAAADALEEHAGACEGRRTLLAGWGD